MSTTKSYFISRPLVLLVLAAPAACLMMVALARPAQAATPLTVTNTNDSGLGSLRQAILDANAAAGTDTINFDPPLSGQNHHARFTAA